jgi:hypothetical protein
MLACLSKNVSSLGGYYNQVFYLKADEIYLIVYGGMWGVWGIKNHNGDEDYFKNSPYIINSL